MGRKAVLLLMCFSLGVMITGCNVVKKQVTPKTSTEAERSIETEESLGDTFELGTYSTEGYTVKITESGMVENERLLVRFTLENKSAKTLSPDKVWGYTLKVTAGGTPLVLDTLNTEDGNESIKEGVDNFHKDVKSGESIDCTLVFDLPSELSGITPVVTALDNKTNKSLGDYELSTDKLELESDGGTAVKASKADSESDDKPSAEDKDEHTKTDADKALENTERK